MLYLAHRAYNYDNKLIRDEKEAIIKHIETLESNIINNKDDKLIRKEELINQIAPFDIVQEFNISVEKWRETSQPLNDVEVKNIIILIGKFLIDYSLRVNHTPLYLRQAIDGKHLLTLGVIAEEKKAKKNDPSSSDDRKTVKKGKRIIVKSLESLVEEEGAGIPAAATSLLNTGAGIANDALVLVVPTERKDGIFPVGADDSPSTEELLTFPSKKQVSTTTYTFFYRYISLHVFDWYVDRQESVSLLALDMAAVPLDRMC